jgi:hypothetical protein
MDPMHITMLYDMLTLCKFKNILEIGVYNGISSSAIVAALQEGSLQSASFVDLKIQCVFPRYENLYTYEDDSLNLISSDFDVIMVDGDHRLPHVAKETALIAFHRIPTVMMHDTNASNVGYLDCDGPEIMLKALKRCGYHIFEDKLKRDRMRTERGFGLATLDPKVAVIAEKIIHA